MRALQNQLDAARAHEARRRQPENQQPKAAGDSGELWRNRAGLLFGLVAIGVVVWMAVNSGVLH